jgi:hypothetical protein
VPSKKPDYLDQGVYPLLRNGSQTHVPAATKTASDRCVESGITYCQKRCLLVSTRRTYFRGRLQQIQTEPRERIERDPRGKTPERENSERLERRDFRENPGGEFRETSEGRLQ